MKLGLIDKLDFKHYEGKRLNTHPLAEQIFYQRKQYYVISDDKYEYNQFLILLLVKSVSSRYLKFEQAVRFYVNLTDCDILYFKAFGYNMLGFICSRMRGSEKFKDYYTDALRLKEEKRNFLERDFERIYSCR